jgi:hypothetical protein
MGKALKRMEESIAINEQIQEENQRLREKLQQLRKRLRLAVWAPNLITFYGFNEGIVGKTPRLHHQCHEELGFVQCSTYVVGRKGESIGWSPREEVYSNDGTTTARIGNQGGNVDETSRSPSDQGRGKAFYF